MHSVANEAVLPPLPQAAGVTRLALERVHGALPQHRVSLGWLHRELEAQAVYLLIFVLALLGTLPGASLPAGLAICVLAGQLLLSGGKAGLPAKLAAREIAVRPARYALSRAIALSRLCERVLPVARSEASSSFRFMANILLFVLGATLLIPIPLSNVLPAIAAAALSLALVEGSFMLFVASSLGAVASLGFMAVTVAVALTFVRL
jgi:hypothetical protein